MNIFIMQNSIVRPLGRDAQNALIGFEGENDARTFVIRTQDDIADYTVSLVIGEVDCGPMTKTAMPDGSTMLSLTLASNMLGVGGEKICQLIMVDEDVVMKSGQFTAYVGKTNDITSAAVDSATLIVINEAITQAIADRMPSYTDPDGDGNIVITLG